MSEYNDFDRRPEDDTFESCFANVRQTDFFILLIGSKRGSWYLESGQITVTRQEYREAQRTAAQRPLKIIPFVRQSVMDALEQWQKDNRPDSTSPLLEDPSFTESFLDELRAPPEDSPKEASRWLYEFSDFRDIVEALRPVLQLNVNLSARLLKGNLLNELVYNLTQMVGKTKDGHPSPHHFWVELARKDIVLKEEDLKGQVWLTKEQLGISIGTFHLVMIQLRGLQRSAIKQAIAAGLFLQMDPLSGELKETEARTSLVLLDRDLDSLASANNSEFVQQIAQKFVGLAIRANTGLLGSGTYVNGGELAIIFGTHDLVVNAFNAMTRFAQWLLGKEPSPIAAERRPTSPVEGMSEEIQSENFTTAELKSYLSQQVWPFGPRLTPARAETLLKNGKILSHLRSLLPNEVATVVSDEDLQRFVEEELIASLG